MVCAFPPARNTDKLGKLHSLHLEWLETHWSPAVKQRRQIEGCAPHGSTTGRHLQRTCSAIARREYKGPRLEWSGRKSQLAINASRGSGEKLKRRNGADPAVIVFGREKLTRAVLTMVGEMILLHSSRGEIIGILVYFRPEGYKTALRWEGFLRDCLSTTNRRRSRLYR